MAAVVDVESILVSGPVVVAGGFVIARLAFGADRYWALLFGLGGATIAVAVGSWIAIEDWGPHEAQGPVTVVLGVAVAVYLVMAAMALRERSPGVAERSRRGRWQFTVGSLLMLTLLVAVPLGSYRTSGGGPAGVAVAVAAVQAVIVSVTLWRFRLRQSAKQPPPSDLG